MLRYSVAGLLACATVCAGIVVGGCIPPETPPFDDTIRCSAATPAVRDSLRLLCPSGGETYHVGDSVEIKWSYPTNWPYSSMTVDLYVEEGLKMFPEINPQPIDATYRAATDSWVWEIPETIVRWAAYELRDTVHLAGQTWCYIKVRDWSGNVASPDPTAYFSIVE